MYIAHSRLNFAFATLVFLILLAPKTALTQNPEAIYKDLLHSSEELRKADEVLNETYKTLLSCLNKEGKNRTKQSQRGWLDQRNAFLSASSDRALESRILSMTNERIAALKSLMVCKSGETVSDHYEISDSISEVLDEDERGRKPCEQYSLSMENNGEKGPEKTFRLQDRHDNFISIKNVYVELYSCVDIDNDGIMEAVIHESTGGWHCCNSFRIYKTVGNKLELFGSFARENTNRAAFKDLNGDGIKEIVTFDIINYIEDLCYACSPELPLIYCYRENELKECTKEFPQIIKREIKENLKKREQYLKDGSIDSKDPYMKGFAMEFLSLFELLGKEDEGWQGVKKWYPYTYEWLKNYSE